jgi:hypothetical protein
VVAAGEAAGTGGAAATASAAAPAVAVAAIAFAGAVSIDAIAHGGESIFEQWRKEREAEELLQDILHAADNAKKAIKQMKNQLRRSLEHIDKVKNNPDPRPKCHWAKEALTLARNALRAGRNRPDSVLKQKIIATIAVAEKLVECYCGK